MAKDKKGKAVRENTDLAFDVYCEKGGNVVQTLVELEKRGLSLARSTFYDWMKERNFEERRIQVEEERQRLQNTQLTFEEQMLRDLLEQKRMYEKYFKTMERPDNQAMFAYTNLVKTLVELSRKIGARETKDPEEMKRLAKEVLETEYGIKRK